jgi:hypothetical protein
VAFSWRPRRAAQSRIVVSGCVIVDNAVVPDHAHAFFPRVRCHAATNSMSFSLSLSEEPQHDGARAVGLAVGAMDAMEREADKLLARYAACREALDGESCQAGR